MSDHDESNQTLQPLDAAQAAIDAIGALEKMAHGHEKGPYSTPNGAYVGPAAGNDVATHHLLRVLPVLQSVFVDHPDGADFVYECRWCLATVGDERADHARKAIASYKAVCAETKRAKLERSNAKARSAEPAKPGGDLPKDREWLSARELAEGFGVNNSALRSRLDRKRQAQASAKQCSDDWCRETKYTLAREPRRTYLVGKVRPLIEGLMERKSKRASKRASKKK